MGKPNRAESEDSSLPVLKELAGKLPPRDRARLIPRISAASKADRTAVVDAFLGGEKGFSNGLISADQYAVMRPFAMEVIERVTDSTKRPAPRAVQAATDFHYDPILLHSRLSALPFPQGAAFASFLRDPRETADLDVEGQLRALATHGQGIDPRVMGQLGKGRARSMILGCLGDHFTNRAE